jgi:hypothetical protein
MATVEEALAAFPEDTEPEPPFASNESQSARDLSMEGTRPSPSPEENESCLLAVKAAMDVIDEFCGAEGFPVTLAGMTVRVPKAVFRIAQMKVELPLEPRIDAIRESKWMTDLSSRLCTEIRGFTAGTPEHDECAAMLGERMTEELVK